MENYLCRLGAGSFFKPIADRNLRIIIGRCPIKECSVMAEIVTAKYRVLFTLKGFWSLDRTGRLLGISRGHVDNYAYLITST
jgi:hypothetical protein